MTDIEKLKELEAKATRGRWQVGFNDGSGLGEYDTGYSIVAPEVAEDETVVFSGDNYGCLFGIRKKEDAEFIAAAKDAIPTLLASLASKDAEIERLKAERGKALAAVAFIADEGTYSDSYGVPGSDFGVCRFCEAGGGPGVPFEHNKNCPILRCEQVAEQWWEDRQIDIEDAAELRADSAESRLTTALAALGEFEADFAEFAKHENWSLSYKCPWYCDDDDQERCWVVTKVHGGINDREWTEIGKGKTPSEALRKARATLAKLNEIEGNEDD